MCTLLFALTMNFTTESSHQQEVEQSTGKTVTNILNTPVGKRVQHQ